MPWLHTKSCRARSVNRCHITKCGQQKRHICIIGITKIPFRFCLFDFFKVYIWQIFTHQFSTTAGNQNVTGIIAVIFHQLLPAFFRCITDTDTASFVTIWSQFCAVTHFFKLIQCMSKSCFVRFNVAAKGWCHKADTAILF